MLKGLLSRWRQRDAGDSLLEADLAHFTTLIDYYISQSKDLRKRGEWAIENKSMATIADVINLHAARRLAVDERKEAIDKMRMRPYFTRARASLGEFIVAQEARMVEENRAFDATWIGLLNAAMATGMIDKDETGYFFCRGSLLSRETHWFFANLSVELAGKKRDIASAERLRVIADGIRAGNDLPANPAEKG
jgi:hypothetical protein